MGQLFNAVNMGSEQTVSDLLSQGVDVDETGMAGATPLHLTAGLDEYVVGGKGKPPPNNTAVAKLLIERGADISARSPAAAGRRPLHGFAEHDNIEVAALLLERGADVNARDADGRTPLHLAARWGNVRTVKLLLDHGADVDAKVGGSTPIGLAKMNKHDDVVRLLEPATD